MWYRCFTACYNREILPAECGRIHPQMALESAPERVSVAEADSSGYTLDARVREQQLAPRLVYPERLHVARGRGPEGTLENSAKVTQTEASPVRQNFDRKVMVQMRSNPGRKFGKAIIRPALELGEIECV
jgi:hypothetical protein